MVILITGCSKGIGLELVKRLSQNHHIIAVSRNAIPYSHPHIFQVNGDINLKSTLQTCQDYLDKNHFPLDILINNAGRLVNKKFETISEQELFEIYQTNVFAPFYWIQGLLNYLKKSPQAHIVNISSMGGVTGTQKFPGLSAYSSSKGALSILTECLAEEFKNENIKCNALALGAVQTEMLSQAFPEYKAPLSSSEMAEFITWFALNGHKFFNGKILPVALSTP
ncbi:MAG: short-chain dehydrogenase [Bacteroidia bacterium]|nr:MAG: short-chain dehydrogenase [Bacteroidia bacterium]